MSDAYKSVVGGIDVLPESHKDGYSPGLAQAADSAVRVIVDGRESYVDVNKFAGNWQAAGMDILSRSSTDSVLSLIESSKHEKKAVTKMADTVPSPGNYAGWPSQPPMPQQMPQQMPQPVNQGWPAAPQGAFNGMNFNGLPVPGPTGASTPYLVGTQTGMPPGMPPGMNFNGMPTQFGFPPSTQPAVMLSTVNLTTPEPPNVDVFFDMDAGGALTAWYHAVVTSDKGMLLIFDNRSRGASQFVPPEGRPIKVRCAALGDRQVDAASCGLSFTIGTLEVVVLIFLVQSQEPSKQGADESQDELAKLMTAVLK